MREKNISRRDFQSIHGWVVRSVYITRYFRRLGQTVGQNLTNWYFDDLKLGGKQNSLKAAIRFRDRYLKKGGAKERIPGEVGRVYKGTKTYLTNIPGFGSTRVSYEAWFAWVRVNGKAKSTSYMIEKHGEKGAKKLASQWLKKQRR